MVSADRRDWVNHSPNMADSALRKQLEDRHANTLKARIIERYLDRVGYADPSILPFCENAKSEYEAYDIINELSDFNREIFECFAMLNLFRMDPTWVHDKCVLPFQNDRLQFHDDASTGERTYIINTYS